MVAWLFRCMVSKILFQVSPRLYFIGKVRRCAPPIIVEAYFCIECEAAWIKFKYQRPFAICIHNARINAVLGKPSFPGAFVFAPGAVLQDYIVSGAQEWLSSYNSTDGTFKQFTSIASAAGHECYVDG